MNHLRHGLLAAALATGTSVALAGPVTNGGFESGDFSGWNLAGDTVHATIDGVAPHGGAYTARFSASTGTALGQLLATVPGASYDVSFWFRTEGASDNAFSFDWDGGAAEYTVSDANPGFATLHFTLVASSASTPITFLFRHGDGRWSLDDVVVTGPGGGGTVPAPATLVLAGLGLLGSGLQRATRARRHGG